MSPLHFQIVTPCKYSAGQCPNQWLNQVFCYLLIELDIAISTLILC